MRGLVASPAARLATASDGPQGHLQAPSQPLGSIPGKAAGPSPRSLLFSRRSRSMPLNLRKAKPWRHGLERVSASECTIEEADSEYPRFKSTVIKPGRPEAGRCFSQQPHGTLAEILRRVFGTRPSEVAQLTSAGAVSASDMPIMIGACSSSAATESPDRRCSRLEIS